jgi:hypothetical protein
MFLAQVSNAIEHAAKDRLHFPAHPDENDGGHVGSYVKRPPLWLSGLHVVLTSAALITMLRVTCADRYPFVLADECKPCNCGANGQLTCKVAAQYGRESAVLDLRDRGIRSIEDDAFCCDVTKMFTLCDGTCMRPAALDLSGNRIDQTSVEALGDLAGNLEMLYLWGNDANCSDVAATLPKVKCV